MQKWLVTLEIKDQGQIYEQRIIVEAKSDTLAMRLAKKEYMRTTPWAFTKPKALYAQVYS